MADHYGFRASGELGDYIERVAEARDMYKSDVIRESVELARAAGHFSVVDPEGEGGGETSGGDGSAEKPAARVDAAARARQAKGEGGSEDADANVPEPGNRPTAGDQGGRENGASPQSDDNDPESGTVDGGSYFDRIRDREQPSLWQRIFGSR